MEAGGQARPGRSPVRAVVDEGLAKVLATETGCRVDQHYMGASGRGGGGGGHARRATPDDHYVNSAGPPVPPRPGQLIVGCQARSRTGAARAGGTNFVALS